MLLALLALFVSATPSPDMNVVRSTTLLADGGTPIWYVDMRGNDTNSCTVPFTDGGLNGPCRQPQAAINKIPKLLKHLATVLLDAGTYNGVHVSGFTADSAAPGDAGAGLTISGVFVNSTLATGSATGTATAGTAGTLPAFGTLTDGAQTLTTDDLVGRIVSITGGTGSGQKRIISSNTATVITIVGTWTAPTAGSTYVIQDSASIFNAPAVGGTFGQYIYIANNDLNTKDGALTISGIRTTGNPVPAVQVTDSTNLLISLSQFILPGQVLVLGSTSSVTFRSGGAATVQFSDCYASSALNQGVGGMNTGILSSFRSLWNSFAYAFVVTGPGASVFRNSEVRNADDVGLSVSGGELRVSGSRISCSSSIRIGISNSNQVSSSTIAAFAPTLITGVSGTGIVTTYIDSTCGVGVLAAGDGTNILVDTLSGAPSVTALEARFGGSIQYTAATTITGGTQDVKVDSAYTGTLASIGSGTCKDSAVGSYGSRVCKR